MKKYELKTIEKVILTKVICDRCGTDCLSTHFDILIKFSFSENEGDIFETLCFECFDKYYKKKMQEYKQNALEFITKQT